VAITFAISLVGDRLMFSTLYGYAGEFAAVGLGASVVASIGLVDDFGALTSRGRLVLQLLSALVVVAVGYRVDAVFDYRLGVAGIPLTVLWVVGVTNAFNLIDGLDGLAAGVAVIITATLFAIFVYSGSVAEAMMLSVVAGALLGFLRYNFYPAKIFLSESGTLLIGFYLSVVAIDAANKLAAAVAIVVPLLAFGLPIADAALTLLRNILRRFYVVRVDGESERYEFRTPGGTPLFEADRRQIHDRLVDAGVTHRNVVLVVYGVSVLLAAGAFTLVAEREPNHALFLGAFGIASVVGIGRLRYSEMQVLRNGVLLPIFDSPLLSRRLFHVLVDLVFIVASYLGAHIVLYEAGLGHLVRTTFFRTVPLVAFAQIAAFTAAGLYWRSFRYTGVADLLVMGRALAVAVAAAWLARYVVGTQHPMSFAVTVVDAYLLSTLVIASRVSFRVLDFVFKRERERGRRTLIYGAGAGGVLALREIEGNAALDMNVVGFLDDSPAKCRRGLQGRPVHETGAIEGLIAAGAFDELLVATAKIPEERLTAIAERCEVAGIPVRRFAIGWGDVRSFVATESGSTPFSSQTASAR
jgi:UDP-GlcNAc:undecaprenyl-phosphate GlcNAc-1-phosphate transferase